MPLVDFVACCRPCSAADPTSDTVKIDMDGAMREQFEERDTRERTELKYVRRTYRDMLEEQRKVNARAEAEVSAQGDATADAEASLKRKHIEGEEAHRRQEDVDARRFAEGQRRVAEVELSASCGANMKGKLDELLKEYGVTEVNQRKKSLMGFKYALHYAVEKGDVEAVRLLLHFKADASLLNSSKKTALQLAEKAKTKDDTIRSMLRTTRSGLC